MARWVDAGRGSGSGPKARQGTRQPMAESSIVNRPNGRGKGTGGGLGGEARNEVVGSLGGKGARFGKKWGLRDGGAVTMERWGGGAA